MGRAVEARYFDSSRPPYPWSNNTTTSGAVTSDYNLRVTEIDLGSGQMRIPTKKIARSELMTIRPFAESAPAESCTAGDRRLSSDIVGKYAPG